MFKKILLGVAGLVVLLVVVGVATGGGGSSSSDATFSDERFDIAFTYPSELEKTDEVETGLNAGGRSQNRTALAFDESNGVIVSRFRLQRRVTAANLERFVPEVDGVVAAIGDARGDTRRSTLGGLPALRYEVGLEKPRQGLSDVVFLFDGKVEYEINCQSTPAKRKEIAAACEQILGTLERRG